MAPRSALLSQSLTKIYILSLRIHNLMFIISLVNNNQPINLKPKVCRIRRRLTVRPRRPKRRPAA